MIHELIHGKVRLKLKFVTLTAFSVLQDMNIEPDNVQALANISENKYRILEFLSSIIYNGQKVYYKDVDKPIPYVRSEVYDIITKEIQGDSNLDTIATLFIESITGKKIDEIKLESGEEKKIIG